MKQLKHKHNGVIPPFLQCSSVNMNCTSKNMVLYNLQHNSAVPPFLHCSSVNIKSLVKTYNIISGTRVPTFFALYPVKMNWTSIQNIGTRNSAVPLFLYCSLYICKDEFIIKNIQHNRAVPPFLYCSSVKMKSQVKT